MLSKADNIGIFLIPVTKSTASSLSGETVLLESYRSGLSYTVTPIPCKNLERIGNQTPTLTNTLFLDTNIQTFQIEMHLDIQSDARCQV